MIETRINNTTSSQHNKRYPWIGIHQEDISQPNPLIVVFIASDEGMIVSGNAGVSCQVAWTYTENDYDETEFVPFEGTITITNTR